MPPNQPRSLGAAFTNLGRKRTTENKTSVSMQSFALPDISSSIKGVGYLYTTTMQVGSIFKHFTKSLTISFNENDEVSDITFTSSRE